MRLTNRLYCTIIVSTLILVCLLTIGLSSASQFQSCASTGTLTDCTNSIDDILTTTVADADYNNNHINYTLFSNASISGVYLYGVSAGGDSRQAYTNISVWSYTSSAWENISTFISPTGKLDFTLDSGKAITSDRIRFEKWGETGWNIGTFYEILVKYADVGYPQYNPFIYELDYASYNFTYNITGTPSGNLWINGTKYTGTSTSLGGSKWLFSKTIDVPGGSTGNKNIWWEIYNSTSDYNSTKQIQLIQATNLSICGSAPNNVKFINFTFKNETTSLQSVNASIPSSTWTYWLNTKTVNKTYLFSSTTNNLTWMFCFNPPSRNVNTEFRIDYTNPESQQRTYEVTNGLLTNTTTHTTLYLMPSILGLYTRYLVVDSIGTPLTGVLGTVKKDISGTSTTLTTATTDSSGQVIFFLNPDSIYDYTFSKSGYTDTSFSLQPNSAETYTVTMGSGLTTAVNGTTISLNTIYSIEPSNSTLNNNTDYTFSFTVTSEQTITSISVNITNSTGQQMGFDDNAGAGTASVVVNTGNQTRLTGHFIIKTATETQYITRIWTTGVSYAGDYSLYKQMTMFTDYGFRDVWKYLIVLSTIVMMLIYMSKNEALDTSESKIIAVLLVIWLFSIVGWLDTGLAISDDASTTLKSFAEFGSQYGIAIVSSFAGSFFILRRLFV